MALLYIPSDKITCFEDILRLATWADKSASSPLCVESQGSINGFIYALKEQLEEELRKAPYQMYLADKRKEHEQKLGRHNEAVEESDSGGAGSEGTGDKKEQVSDKASHDDKEEEGRKGRSKEGTEGIK